MPEHDRLLGTTVAGKYRLERLLGEGGMGIVFEAINVQLGRRVALKRLRPGAVHDPKLVARFHQEARAAAAVGSDHIIDVLDIVQDDEGAPWIVMEVLVGESLARRMAREHRLDPAVAVPVVLQVLSGLAIAHARGVVHRDLKPENLFLEERSDGTSIVKILDFGISKIQDESLQSVDKLTATGMMMGTAHYMSPEQARGRPDVDHRSDLYSAAAILYECLAGQTPFSASSYNEMIAKLLTEDPPAIESLVPGLPATLVAVIQKAMARDRDQRFQSASEMQEALAASMGYPVARMTPSPRVVTPPPGSLPSIPSSARAVITPPGDAMPPTAIAKPTAPAELAKTALDPSTPAPTPLHGESGPPTSPPASTRSTVLWVGAGIAVLVLAGWFISVGSRPSAGRVVERQRGIPDAAVRRPVPPPPAAQDAGARAAPDAATAQAARRLRVVVSRPSSGGRIRIGDEEHVASEWTFDLPAGDGAVHVSVSAPGHREKAVDHDPRAGDLVVELTPVRASVIDDANPYRKSRR